MADNLKLQQDINKAIAERNKMLAEGEAAIQRQAKLYATLLDVMAGKKGSEAIDQMIQKMESAKTSMQQMAQGAQEATEKTSKSFNVTEKDIDRLSGSSKSLSTHMSSKFPKAFVVAAAAVSGFKQGIQNVLAVGKSMLSLTEGVVGGLVNITKSILSIPFKIFDGLIEKAQAGGGGNELAQAFEDVRKEFGSFKQDVAKNVIESARSMKGELSNTGLSVWKVFGNLAERLKYVAELAKGMGATFHTLGTEIAKNAENIGAYQKGLGLSAEEMGGIGERAMAMGTTLTDQLQDIANMSLQMGDAFGLSAKMISRDVGKMIKDVKNFGSLTVKEMTEAVVYTKKLGIEVNKLLGLIDKFDTFEGAAESAAKLSQAFGVNVNAFEMMKEQDPSKRLAELKKQFELAGKSADNLSRQELKLISDATGLDEATAKLALSSKNQGVSMDDVKKKSDAAQKKQLTQAETMEKLADAIERLVQSGGPQGFKGFFDAFLKGVGAGITSSKEFMTLMYTIRQALMKTFQIGVDLGRWLVANFPGVLKIFTSLTNIIKKVPEFFTTLSAQIKKFVSGDISLEGFFENMKDAANKFLGGTSGFGATLLQGFKETFTKLAKIVAEGIKFVIPKLTEGLKQVTEFLKNPKEFLASASAGGSTGLKFVMEVIKPIVDAVKDPKMWESLWTAFKDFAGTFWEILKEKAIIPMLKAVPASWWLGVAGIFFGPAVGKAFLGAGVNLLVGHLKNTFVGAAEKAIADKVGETAVSKLSETVMKNGIEQGATAAAKSGAGNAGKFASLLANPYVLVAAAAVAITVGAFALAKTSMKKESEKLQDAIDSEDFLKEIEDKSLSTEAKIRKIREERIKHLKKADDEEGAGILNWIRGGMSEQEADARAKAESLNKMLVEEKQKRDRALVVGTPEYQQKMAQAAAENKKRILDAMGPVTVENAAERFKKIDDLAKQLMSKNFDLAEKMKMIKEKLATVDFSLFENKAKEDQVNQALSSLESIKVLFAVISDIGILTNKAGASMKMIDDKGVKTSFGSLRSFVDTVVVGIVDMKFVEKMQFAGTYSKSAAVNLKALSDNMTEIAKAVSEANVAMKTIQGSSLNNQGPQITTSILRLVNTINVASGDIGTISSSASSQLAKIKATKEMFSEMLDIGKSAAEISKVQNLDNVRGVITSLKNSVATALEVGNLPIDGDKLSKIKLSKQMFAEVADIQTDAAKIVKAVQTGGIEKSFKAVVDMVKKVQEMNDAVTSMTNKPMEIKTRLQQLATSLGMGSQQTYQIKNNGIEIKLNLQVTMDAGKVEEVIVRRSDSKIRKAFGDTGLKDTQSLNSHLGTPY